MTWYNTEHRHSAIRFVTPQQRHEGKDHAILKVRTETYETAKRNQPDRWRNRDVRNWEPTGTVWLNPDKPAESLPSALQLAA